jgi:hypothetical protein
MTELYIADSAGDKWDTICETDPKLAEVLDKVFGRIEDDSQLYRQYANHARFVQVNVPGRDDVWTVVWEWDDTGSEPVAAVLALEKLNRDPD